MGHPTEIVSPVNEAAAVADEKAAGPLGDPMHNAEIVRALHEGLNAIERIGGVPASDNAASQ